MRKLAFAAFVIICLPQSGFGSTAEELVAKRFRESERQWEPVLRGLGILEGSLSLSLNDDGSVQIERPSVPGKKKGFFSHRCLLSMVSDPDAFCGMLGRSADIGRHSLGAGSYANELSLRGGGWTSSCLGIPHIPDNYSTSQYGLVTSRGIERQSIDGENIGKISCYLTSLSAPVSRVYKKITYLPDGKTAVIQSPEFRWVGGLTSGKRKISYLTSPEIVCRHYGFDFYVKDSLKTDTGIFSGKALVLDEERRVVEVHPRGTDGGRFIKSIGCAI